MKGQDKVVEANLPDITYKKKRTHDTHPHFRHIQSIIIFIIVSLPASTY